MKKPSKYYRSGWLAALLCVPFVVNAEQPDPRGYMLASSCAACHGPDGQSPGAIPSLSGKDQAYIANALKAFKSGEQPATVMNRLAKGYSDEEIDIIAKWFATR